MTGHNPRMIDETITKRLENKNGIPVEGAKWCGRTTICKQQAANGHFARTNRFESAFVRDCLNLLLGILLLECISWGVLLPAAAANEDETRSISLLSDDVGTAEEGFHFDLHLDGKPRGFVVTALCAKNGQILTCRVVNAAEQVSVLFDPMQPASSARIMWVNTQFCSMHDSIKINLRENILKILVFGNSYSYSTLGYLPELMREAAPELSFSMGLLYKSGADLANHIEYFNQDTPYPRYSEYLSSNGHFTNTENLITSKEALDRQDWDVIILQANRPYLEDDPYLQIEQLKNLISEYLDYPIDYMLNQNQTRAAMNDSSLSEIAGDTILEKSIVNVIINFTLK